jgi:hypothetical protein
MGLICEQEMAVKILRKYGKLRKIFRGAGSVSFSDGSNVSASFWLVQLASTKLLVCADVRHPRKKFLSGHLEAVSLQGTLADGRRISATKLHIKESEGALFTSKVRLVLLSGYWTIGDPKIGGEASVVFELVNFRYHGTEADENGARSLMTLVLGGRRVQLRQIAGYGQVVAVLSALRGVQVTCTATTTITSMAEIDDVVSMMDSLCGVMSVARGTLVSWTSLEISVIDGVSPYSQYRSSVSRPFEGMGLIPGDDSASTKHFIEEGFRRSKELSNNFPVRAIVHDFIEATGGGAFIENRSLRIAVLVEYLANIYARLKDNDGSLFFSPEVFKAAWESFEAEVRSALGDGFTSRKRKYLNRMLRGMEGALNRRPLKDKIVSLANWLGIKFLPDEIDRFVAARDLLAHEGKFPDEGSPVEHYLRMQHFLDRIVLRFFGYGGPYYDFEHQEIRYLEGVPSPSLQRPKEETSCS